MGAFSFRFVRQVGLWDFITAKARLVKKESEGNAGQADFRYLGGEPAGREGPCGALQRVGASLKGEGIQGDQYDTEGKARSESSSFRDQGN